MGGSNLSGDKADSGQQRGVLWSLSAHLWGGRPGALVSASGAAPKALCHIPAVGIALFRAGVWRQPPAGVEMGHALVGLQRIFPESERAHLPAGGGLFWFGGHAAQLLSAAQLYEVVPSDQTRLAAGPVRRAAGGVYTGYYLLCGKTPHRP